MTSIQPVICVHGDLISSSLKTLSNKRRIEGHCILTFQEMNKVRLKWLINHDQSGSRLAVGIAVVTCSQDSSDGKKPLTPNC